MVKDIRIIILTLFMSAVSCFAYPLDNKNTAGHLKDKVDSMSLSMNVNSKLLFVKSDTVNVSGTSNYWTYCYVTIDTPKYLYFHTNDSNVVFDSVSFYLLVGSRWISQDWIDSDSAVTLADQQGGNEFRFQYPAYRIQASLSEPLVPNSYPIWYITYISSQNPNYKKLFIINATKNDTPTNVKYFKNIKYHPAEYFLFPNYPNPFNPSTTIKYQILKESNVTIKIYDGLGREVTTLLNAEQKAGRYEVEWNAKDFASGIYFYQIRAGDFIATRKMLLIK